MLSFAEPPRSVCILRLSAIGDACHVVPIVRTLQQAWPSTQLTWIIGKTEARLMGLIEGVEFIIVDKRASASARRAQRAQLKGASFDVLLHMQLALRASLVARTVPAAIKVGFDRARARELQWLFTNARIAPRVREHVLDSFFGFTERLASHSASCAGTCRCRQQRRSTPSGSSPTPSRRWSSAPARAMRCATGSRSATPRWPSMQSSGTACA